jgi:glycopeptide antibiotics resistance protein
MNDTNQVREMNGNTARHSSFDFLVRHYVELLTLLTILFVLQTGLVPFDFTRGDIEKGSAAFFTATASHLTFPDTVANIFLYVPVGVFLHWTIWRVVRRRAPAFPIAVALAAAMSVSVEWVQAYSPARVSSMIDLIANVLGAAIGAAVSGMVRASFPKLVGATILEVHAQPRTAMLRAYCLMLVVFAAIPFSFSFDSIRLKKAVKSANFVPFRASTIEESLADDVQAEGDYIAYAHLKWRRMKRWSRWAAECASFAVLALLLHAVLRRDYGFSGRATMALSCWIGGGLAVGLSIMQLLIVSRACDVTDVLFRLLGLGSGMIVRAVRPRVFGELIPSEKDQRLRRLMQVGCAATLAYIVYTGVIPLTLDAGTAGPTTSLASERLLPFYAYFHARFDVMMDDVMEKFAAYVIFSALLASLWSNGRVLRAKPRLLGIIAIGVAVSALIEIVQMFISVRVTSLTDPMLAAGGCLAGVLARQHLGMLYRFATSEAAVSLEEIRPAPVPLAPADALVASLTEPHPEAPVEPSPRRRPPVRR